MTTRNRTLALNMFSKHETLKLTDAAKKENLGMIPKEDHLRFLLEKLVEEGYIQTLAGATACTYTITDKGIAESERLNRE